jgi:hypothetical protein
MPMTDMVARWEMPILDGRVLGRRRYRFGRTMMSHPKKHSLRVAIRRPHPNLRDRNGSCDDQEADRGAHPTNPSEFGHICCSLGKIS